MSESPVQSSDLLDPDFLESVARLRIVARRVARGGRPAEQRSLDLGSGIEFRDFRPYSAGDDLRSIDWNIYRRLGRVFLRLFEEVEDLPLYLLMDNSRSLHAETPSRAVAAQQVAVALTTVATGQHDTAGVFPFSEDVEVLMRPRSGKGSLLRLARALSTLPAGGATDFERSFRRFAAMGNRRGLCVVISDFFDPGGLSAITQALKQVKHRLLLVQLVRPSDSNPELQGDLRLVDCESGVGEDVSMTPAVLDAYRQVADEFNGGLTDFARKMGAGLLRLNCDEAVVPQLATLFEGGVLRI